MLPFGFGATELLIVLVIGVFIFGPKRLPDIGRTIGKATKELRNTVAEVEDVKKSTIGQVDELKDSLRVDLNERPNARGGRVSSDQGSAQRAPARKAAAQSAPAQKQSRPPAD